MTPVHVQRSAQLVDFTEHPLRGAYLEPRQFDRHTLMVLTWALHQQHVSTAIVLDHHQRRRQTRQRGARPIRQVDQLRRRDSQRRKTLSADQLA